MSDNSTPMTRWPCVASQTMSRLLPASGTKTALCGARLSCGQKRWSPGVDLLLMKPDVAVLPTLVPEGLIHRVSSSQLR